MKTRAAVLRKVPGRWEVHTVDLDEPREHEVLVRIVAAGLCHSDDHFATGDITVGHLPFCGGHEAAGIVEAIGPGVSGLSVGDQIVTSFIPGCGRCRWCASGLQNLCDNGALMLEGTQLDGTFRMHLDGEDVAQAGLLSAFSEYSVMPEWSCIKISNDVPAEIAALLGCAVPTGWGSAVNGAEGRARRRSHRDRHRRYRHQRRAGRPPCRGLTDHRRRSRRARSARSRSSSAQPTGSPMSRRPRARTVAHERPGSGRGDHLRGGPAGRSRVRCVLSHPQGGHGRCHRRRRRYGVAAVDRFARAHDVPEADPGVSLRDDVPVQGRPTASQAVAVRSAASGGDDHEDLLTR